MSGLVAAHGPFDPRLGTRMLARLAHRGPDGEGIREVGGSWLGHRRLAIIDLEGGDQPIGNAAGDLWLIGDGEIYNHRRLRSELDEARFRTRSDHEAVLHLFDDIGIEAFEHLWGTYAFAIAGEDGRFAVARDPVGVVPLYWARRGATVVFASELKAFDEEWRKDLEAFPPGHAWTPEEGLRMLAPFPASAPVLMRSRASHEDPPAWVFDATRDALHRAVEQTLVAEVPVGAFLSGGLDSSIVCAIAAHVAREQGWKLKTFAAGLPDSADLAAAQAVSAHLDTDHHEYVYSPAEAIELVPEVISVLESFDPTLVHSAVPNYLVASLAKEHVRVVLIGEGADELFAGYAHYEAYESPEDLHEELLATIRGLHIGGLQRVDRVTGANSLEARIPFLDLDVVELALALPPEWKLIEPDRPAKWLLRRAFSGWIPDEVLWREKEQFGEGTGMDRILRGHFDSMVTDEELERERGAVDPPLRTREELAYYRLFARHLPGVEAKGIVGRFVEA